MKYFWFSLMFLGIFVVMLGAFTRLVDAGLGCPDWPTCFGYWSLSSAVKNADQAMKNYQMVFDFSKAWPEMYHRYIAGVFGGLIIVASIFFERGSKLCRWALVGLVLFQATLGMWTVTWKLHPLVVMLHLLGGMLLTSGCLWMGLKASMLQRDQLCQLRKPLLLLGFLLMNQILLGGWTSANYASMVCYDFPWCVAKTIPTLNWFDAFNLWLPIGQNYEGGHMDFSARVTVHMLHRFLALMVVISLGWVTYRWYSLTRRPLSKIWAVM